MNTLKIRNPKIASGKIVAMKTKSVQLGYCHSLNRKVPIEGYETESCVDLPIKDGDGDYDNAKYKREWHATLEEATAWAEAHIDNDFWGAISIIPYALTPFSEFPNIYHLEYTGDATHVERE